MAILIVCDGCGKLEVSVEPRDETSRPLPPCSRCKSNDWSWTEVDQVNLEQDLQLALDTLPMKEN